MNGKAATRLRRTFGTGSAYRKAKDAIDNYPTSLAQRPKLATQRARKRNGHGPTWPNTDDQKLQSRPLIVLHPRRRTSPIQLWKMQGKASNTVAREAYGMVPKHLLDRTALLHPAEIV